MAPRAFAELTPAGRLRRLRRLVRAAMAHHDIDVARVRLAGRAFNTTFRIDAGDGRRYALRVGGRWHLNTEGIADVEARWSAALARETAVRPPQVIRTRDGRAAVRVAADGVPGVRECVLFAWQEGRSLRGRVHELELLAATGEVQAVLHAHAAGFDGVAQDDVLRADRVCYLRTPDVLSGRGGILAEGVAWAQTGIDALWRARGHRAHLLHGDLHPNNVLVRHRRVVPIDFQDAAWGLEEQDLAITLVMLDHDDPSGAATAALRRGYQRRRRWPDVNDATLDLLMIARRLHIVNILTTVRPTSAAPYIARVTSDLRRVLRGR